MRQTGFLGNLFIREFFKLIQNHNFTEFGWKSINCFENNFLPGFGINNFCHSLTDVLGLYRGEIDALADGVCNRAVPVAGNELRFRSEYSCSVLAEIAELTSAEPMMVYGDDFYKGRPAVAVNRYENGRAYYIASMFEEDFYCDFFNSIIPACGIEPIVQGLPRGVFASKRGKYIFIQNFSSDAIRLSDSVSDKRKILMGSSDTLPAYGTIVFAE